MCFSCWLNLDFIWSFFGPVCVIIIVSKIMGVITVKGKVLKTFCLFKKKSDAFQVNIFFFLITVWKLAQKFSSLNPDLNSLQKIRWVITNLQAAGACLSCMRAFALARICVRVFAIWNYTFYISVSLTDIKLFRSSLSVRHVYLFCPLQGIYHYCSGPVVCVRHHVDLWLFPVWRKHNNYVLPIHNLWKPSRGYAFCHALSVL